MKRFITLDGEIMDLTILFPFFFLNKIAEKKESYEEQNCGSAPNVITLISTRNKPT